MRLNPLYLLIVFFIHSCNFIDKNPSSLNSFIPKDASIIIRIHNPNKFKSDVLNNSLALNFFNNENNYNFKKQIKIIEGLPENNPYGAVDPINIDIIKKIIVLQLLPDKIKRI